jgi:hypothetical protein
MTRPAGVVLALSIALVGASAACSHLQLAPTPATPPDVSALWSEPMDVAQMDLFNGPGGPSDAPDPHDQFTYLTRDSTGYSHGWDVQDSQGRKWGVKLGREAQSEIAVSRLLWAVGFHQLPSHYVPNWTLTITNHGTTHQPAGRFRLEPSGVTKLGSWRWQQNPFVNSEPLQGLFVLMVMVNNWDLKDTNNLVYQVKDPARGEELWYVVKDLGAALGRKTGQTFPGSRNDVEDFERQPFIKSVEGDTVTFDFYSARQQPRPVQTVTRADVLWISQRLARLSPEQWDDAFRAAGYDKPTADRYIQRLKQKVQEGLAVGAPRR